jgi:hypothetical protein
MRTKLRLRMSKSGRQQRLGEGNDIQFRSNARGRSRKTRAGKTLRAEAAGVKVRVPRDPADTSRYRIILGARRSAAV